MPESVNIFRGLGASEPRLFLGDDPTEALRKVTKSAEDVLGGGQFSFDTAPDGAALQRVAELTVTPVRDTSAYVAKSERTGAAGVAVQSYIFDNENYSEKEAEQWVAQQYARGFSVHKHDDTTRIEMQGPERFRDFKVLPVAKGIRAVIGIVRSSGEVEKIEKTLEQYSAALARSDVVRAVNRGLVKNGVPVIRKSATELEDGSHFILGPVLIPTLDGETGEMSPDKQNHVYTAQEVEKTAHLYMAEFGFTDLGHSWEPLSSGDVQVVESGIVRGDGLIFGDGNDVDEVVRGTWFMGHLIHNPQIWEQVAKGEIGAYSIGGFGKHTEIA